MSDEITFLEVQEIYRDNLRATRAYKLIKSAIQETANGGGTMISVEVPASIGGRCYINALLVQLKAEGFKARRALFPAFLNTLTFGKTANSIVVWGWGEYD